jgi:protein-S-isoprenylcysteine O-methyltransferase Ste14
MDHEKKMNPELKRGLISWAVKGFLYKVYVALVLMLSAGRWDWLAGWLYAAIFLLFDLATAVVVIPHNPRLLLERAKRNPGVKSWDKILMPVSSGLLPLFTWIIAGLHQRYSWGMSVSGSIQIVGAVLTIGGYAVIVWAMGANPFFSVVVRIQEDRGHKVSSGGPYRFIRHPGYLGALIFSTAIPLMLGSWWAVIPGAAASLLFILRTHLEDMTLQEELEGYLEYTEQVNFRLVPGIW